MSSDNIIKFNVSGEILNKPTDRMENAGYSGKDIMAIRAVACYEGVNDNNALFEKDDLEKAVNTLTGKPVRILFDGSNPTGHGYNSNTHSFSSHVSSIGFIEWSYGAINEQTNRYEIVVEMAVWQKYYPEISARMRELHREGNLKFSIEAERDYEITPEGYRRCYNISFTGIAVVQNPAFKEARSLMVAEQIKNGGMNMEKILELLGGINDKIGTEIAEQFKTHLGVLNTQLDTAKTDIVNLKTEIADKDGEIKTLEADRDKYKAIVETAEKEKLGAERLEKLQKYGTVEKKAEELAELSKEDFLALMENMITNYNPQENASIDTALGVAFENVGKIKQDRKAALLQLVEGFGA